MFSSIVVLSLCATLALGSVTSINRVPGGGDTLDYPECTRVYLVEPEGRYTTQGHDLGMAAPHGKNTSGLTLVGVWDVDSRQTVQVSGRDYSKFPYPYDAAKQAYAKSQYSVTALTETGATPLGFQKDTINHYLSICVFVKNVKGRWVEVMATTVQEDQALCVADFGKPDLQENPVETACGNGDLYMCKDAAVASGVPAYREWSSSTKLSNSDTIGFRFFCRDSCEAVDHDFYWRIAVSHQTPVDNAKPPQQPDGENWCGTREGDDFPNSLLDPYPAEYKPPAVFDVEPSSAAAAVASPALLVALLLAFTCCAALF